MPKCDSPLFISFYIFPARPNHARTLIRDYHIYHVQRDNFSVFVNNNDDDNNK